MHDKLIVFSKRWNKAALMVNKDFGEILRDLAWFTIKIHERELTLVHLMALSNIKLGIKNLYLDKIIQLILQ